jgi:transcriptional regulator with PAS, ATPase and Fis domain
MAALMQYEWPGNVRELRHVIELMFVDPPSTIAVDHLPESPTLPSRRGGSARTFSL